MQKRDFFRNVQRKRYASRQFRNPYFSTPDRASRRPFLVAVAAFIGTCLLAGLVFGLINRPIKTTHVSGLQTISPDAFTAEVQTYLDQRVLLLFSQSQKLFFREDGLRDHLQSIYAFEQLDIRTEKSTLTITAVERQPRLLWSSAGELYIADATGVVVRMLSQEERLALGAPVEPEGEPSPLSALPLFQDLNDTPVEIGSPILSQEEILNIFRFHEHLVRQGIGFLETRIDRLAGKWMAVRTSAGYDILFDASGDIDTQAWHLETLLRESVDPSQELEYIDLRFGDHVYYK